jgi:hypothetical protein
MGRPRLYQTRTQGPLYKTWDSMKQRCFNPSHIRFERYGGRGIKVCQAWMQFAAFEQWALNNGYTEGLTVERINNDGDYEPSNCTWVTKGRQAVNRSTTLFVKFNGQTKMVSDWARLYGLLPRLVLVRLARGWSIRRALTTPKNFNQWESGMRRQEEFLCDKSGGGCGRYFTTFLSERMFGNFTVECPGCHHHHFRVIRDGLVTQDRHDMRLGQADIIIGLSCTLRDTPWHNDPDFLRRQIRAYDGGR